MQRQLCWTERQEEGVKREVRVTLQQHSLNWQFKLSCDELWDCDSRPTAADWDALLERMENRYQRRNISHEDLKCVRRLRSEAAERGG